MYKRHGPQPVFGSKEYSYNYAGIVHAKPLTWCSSNPRHSIFVRGVEQVSSLSPDAKVRLFTIVIPVNVFPFDTFRVLLDGLEVLVSCPDVTGPGETVWIFAEHDDINAIVWKEVDSCTKVGGDSVFVGTVAVYSNADGITANEIPLAIKAYYSV